MSKLIPIDALIKQISISQQQEGDGNYLNNGTQVKQTPDQETVTEDQKKVTNDQQKDQNINNESSQNNIEPLSKQKFTKIKWSLILMNIIIFIIFCWNIALQMQFNNSETRKDQEIEYKSQIKQFFSIYEEQLGRFNKLIGMFNPNINNFIEIQQKIISLEGNYTQLSQALSKQASQNELIQNLSNFKDQFNSLKDQVNSMSTNLSTMKQNITDMSNQINSATNQINSLVSDKSTMKQNITDMNSQINSFTNQFNTLNSKITKLEQNISDNTSQASLSANQFTTLNANIATMKQNITDMSSQINSSTNQVNSLFANIATIKQNITDVSYQTNQSINQVNILNTNVSTMKQNISDLSSQATSSVNQITSLNSNMAIIKQNITDLSTSITSTNQVFPKTYLYGPFIQDVWKLQFPAVIGAIFMHPVNQKVTISKKSMVSLFVNFQLFSSFAYYIGFLIDNKLIQKPNGSVYYNSHDYCCSFNWEQISYTLDLIMEAGTYTFGVGLSCYLGIDKGNYIEGYGLTIKVQEL